MDNLECIPLWVLSTWELGKNPPRNMEKTQKGQSQAVNLNPKPPCCEGTLLLPVVSYSSRMWSSSTSDYNWVERQLNRSVKNEAKKNRYTIVHIYYRSTTLVQKVLFITVLKKAVVSLLEFCWNYCSVTTGHLASALKLFLHSLSGHLVSKGWAFKTIRHLVDASKHKCEDQCWKQRKGEVDMLGVSVWLYRRRRF